MEYEKKQNPKEKKFSIKCYRKSILGRKSSGKNIIRNSSRPSLKCCIISLIGKKKKSGRNYGGLSYISGGR